MNTFLLLIDLAHVEFEKMFSFCILGRTFFTLLQGEVFLQFFHQSVGVNSAASLIQRRLITGAKLSYSLFSFH